MLFSRKEPQSSFTRIEVQIYWKKFFFNLDEKDTVSICETEPRRLFFKWKRIYIQWQIQDFPLGGRRPVGEAPTSDAYTFWQKHMRKRKKLILLGGGGGAGGAPGSTSDIAVTSCKIPLSE